MLPAPVLALLAASPFAPLLQENAEWRYTAYTEDAKGKTTDLTLPGEVRLKVVLVRPVGRVTLVALQPLLDGIAADRLKSDMDLELPIDVNTHVFEISDSGLREVGIDLETARTAEQGGDTDEPVVFPAAPQKGWTHDFKYEEAQLQHHAKGTLTEKAGIWTVKWKGKACFAGDCWPFHATQAYSPEQGFVKLCTLMLGNDPMRCLKQQGRETGPAARKPGAPPTLGDIYRGMMQAQPAIASCLTENSVSVLAFNVNPDGTLSKVREKNQSGKPAQCTVTAVAGVRFEPFEGAPIAVERLAFSK